MGIERYRDVMKKIGVDPEPRAPSRFQQALHL